MNKQRVIDTAMNLTTLIELSNWEEDLLALNNVYSLIEKLEDDLFTVYNDTIIKESEDV